MKNLKINAEYNVQAAEEMIREITSYEAMRAMARDLYDDGWTVEEHKDAHDLPQEWIDEIEANEVELDAAEKAQLTEMADYMYRQLEKLSEE